MIKLAAFRVFADHYQFFVHDSDAVACPEYFYDRNVAAPPGLTGDYEVGYITDGKSVCFGTLAHGNSHWIEIYRSDSPMNPQDAERIVALSLDVASGKVNVSDLINLNASVSTVEVPPGRYTIYLLGFDLGKDPADETSDWDAPASAWANAERYRIVLVPGEGHVEDYGVIRGERTLPAWPG